MRLSTIGRLSRLILCAGVLTLVVVGPDSALAQRPSLGQRLQSFRERLRTRWQDFRVRRAPVKNGSVATYVDHCRTSGIGATCTLSESHSKNGSVRRLNRPRTVAGVTTSSAGLKRYLNHVGRNTVELLYNDHSSEYGHMIVRVGSKYYELGNVRQAASGSFAGKVHGWDGLVGMVYTVDPARIPQIQARLEQTIKATTSANLPPFDSYGKPVRVEPVPGHVAADGLQRFKVQTPSKGHYRASGEVRGKLVQQGGERYLQAQNGLKVPVSKVKPDGSFCVESRTCTSFITQPLAELVPELGLGQLSSYAQRYARSAVTNIVRGKTSALPSLVTVYSRRPASQEQVLQRVWDVGKKQD